MKAVFQHVSDPETKVSQFVIDNNVALPPLDGYSILIEVKSCALSHVDCKVLQLLYDKSNDLKYPVGQDISGIVRQVGPDVTMLKPDDEVVGIIPLDFGISGCAEYVVLNEFDVVKKPDRVSFVDAAGCIGDAVKAYTALHYLGRMTGGDTILIMDGATSFGSLAIQLAYHWGAKVLTTTSSSDEKLYLEGLEDKLALIIDLTKRSTRIGRYNNSNSGIILSACMEESSGLGVDIIIDNGVTMFSDDKNRKIANEFYTHPVPSKREILSALAVGGRWVTCKDDLQLDPPNSRILYLKCASVSFLFEQAWTLSSTQQGRYMHILMDIMEKVADGVIQPNIHHTVPFEAVPEALKNLSEERVGKVVMKLD
ncbi:quinone oxidoreductase-like protein 1 [Limulus polyphemus]|uniref:Quinone oxidoreductase-like protein 1 n=1 Tax=Limulus polyphemus TaxID=6850 RepID=A0ABM1BTR9_LIMPO|nr:quinone oxidoreductase-like protein 1 [Limulus polyphemus]